MAELWDRVRKVWDRNLEQSTDRDSALNEVTSALEKVRRDIRQDWTHEASLQQSAPSELAAKYQARIEDYNRIAGSLWTVARAEAVQLIEPEEWQRGIEFGLKQNREESTRLSAAESIPLRLQEQAQEIRDHWAGDLRSNQLRPAQADLYYAGRIDQLNAVLSEARANHPRAARSSPRATRLQRGETASPKPAPPAAMASRIGGGVRGEAKVFSASESVLVRFAPAAFSAVGGDGAARRMHPHERPPLPGRARAL